MEEEKAYITIPLDYIRGLVVAQNACCAITGRKLDPIDVNGDHIIPLSRIDLKPSMGKENLWLVHKTVNAMKGTMTYDELITMAKSILSHEKETRALLAKIHSGNIIPKTRVDFDKWIGENCSTEEGRK